MPTGVNMVCFSASYAVAVALEAAGLWTRPRWRRAAAVVAATASVVAHTWYLGRRASLAPWAPLSSPYDWYLTAAWVLAVIYLAAAVYYSRAAIGLFLLPVTLGLIAAARGASEAPLATFEASRFWGRLHGIFLMLGTVAVLLGFIAGLMYLLQSYRLKRKLPAAGPFRLPSLEWLERINSRSLSAAALLVALGFLTGVLTRASQTDGGGIPWTDPVVLSLSGMLSWLVAAECFQLAYPAARRGRKVAYLTLAGFVFLLLTLATFMRLDGVHGGKRQESGARGQGSLSAFRFPLSAIAHRPLPTAYCPLPTSAGGPP